MAVDILERLEGINTRDASVQWAADAYGEIKKSRQQRDSLIKEARSWLRWASERGSAAEVHQFATTVLCVLDADVAGE